LALSLLLLPMLYRVFAPPLRAPATQPNAATEAPGHSLTPRAGGLV
jgi:hypothetical protein